MNDLIKVQRTMSSLEIAKITGKRHKHVLEAIRNMEPSWEKINGTKFRLVEYKDSKGEMRPCYELTQDECIYIGTKFNDEARARLVRRWKELETERIQDEANPERYIEKSVKAYRRQGKSEKWIATRIQGTVQRNSFTDTLKAHKVDNQGYGLCTNAIYKPLLGGKKNEVVKQRGLAKNANLRDSMSLRELASVMLSESLAEERIEKLNSIGNFPCARQCSVAATQVSLAVKASLIA